MRCRYFACVSFSLAAFFCNHAHARIGETYEESVKRYTAAGFKKTQTTTETPENDKGREYCSLPSSYFPRWDPEGKLREPPPPDCVCTELTWTKDKPEAGGGIEVVKIKQLFFGREVPEFGGQPWHRYVRCREITYTFKDNVNKTSRQYMHWRDQLFEAQNWLKKKGHLRWTYPALEEDAAFDTPKTLHIRFSHFDKRKGGDFTDLFGSGLVPADPWNAFKKKKEEQELARNPPPKKWTPPAPQPPPNRKFDRQIGKSSDTLQPGEDFKESGL